MVSVIEYFSSYGASGGDLIRVKRKVDIHQGANIFALCLLDYILT